MSFTTNSLLEYISNNKSLNAIKSHAETNDQAHDIGHLIRVALWAIKLNPDGHIDSTIAASLLHDIVNLPKNHPDRKHASSFCAIRARCILIDLMDSNLNIDDICDAIEDHSYSAGKIPRSDLGKALQDADRLDAIGVIGMFRHISVSTQLGTPFYNLNDPWAMNRLVDDTKYALDHYNIKLFRIKDTMNTEGGKIEAEIRTVRMQNYLRELEI